MQPYESTYVGSFVFLLGYVACQKKLALHDQSACLLAQNKGDQVIGDLIHQWDGRSIIIEFKRNEATVRSELEKPHKQALIAALSRAPKEHHAWRGHFVAFGSATPADAGAAIHVMRYGEIENADKQTAPRIDAQKFIRRILSSESWGFPPEAFRAYLEILRQLADKHSPSGSGGRAAPRQLGTLIVNCGKDGQLRFLTCDITRTHEMTLELDRSSGRESDRRDRSRSRDRDTGWSW